MERIVDSGEERIVERIVDSGEEWRGVDSG